MLTMNEHKINRIREKIAYLVELLVVAEVEVGPEDEEVPTASEDSSSPDEFSSTGLGTEN